MASLHAYWRYPRFNRDEQRPDGERDVRTGVLTNEHQEALDDIPVLVEELTERVYHPGDLPPGSVIFVETGSGEMPQLAKLARRAGFLIRRA